MGGPTAGPTAGYPSRPEGTIRPYDVVLFGATGFTGQLVAEVLARHTAPEPGAAAIPALRWAIAGRDPAKLQDLKTSLVGIDPANGRVGTIRVDATDPASLREMAAQARIVITTVGPYMVHGLPVVEACVAAKTHCLDLTGEPAFVAETRARFGAEAAANGLRIVHCCGFDSVPADLGALFTVSQLPAGVPKQVRCYVKTNASFSGGTWASFVGAAGAGPVREPSPEPTGEPGDTGGGRPLLHRPPAGLRGIAIPMPVIDVSVVRTSARAMPDRYGPGFAYRQFLVLRSVGRAAQLAAGVGAVSVLARFGPTRRALLRYRPSGEGPSAEVREKSFFSLTFVGKAGDATVVTRVSGGDPGYTETSRMLAHAGLLLARRESELPPAAGVSTPAIAFGPLGIDAMREAGLRFEVMPPGATGT